MPHLIVKNFLNGSPDTVDYAEAWDAMKQWTRERDREESDQLWVLEHSPVYTLGQAANKAHILNRNSIPIVQVDRGGQVTYHGPGQIMFYAMFNLSRLNISVRGCVELLEGVVIDVLRDSGISAQGDRAAPGVYVDGAKVAALGLRVSRGCTYHGLCFNYLFDAAPFNDINPCGYEGMEITQLASLLSSEQDKQLPSKEELVETFVSAFQQRFGFEEPVVQRQSWSKLA